MTFAGYHWSTWTFLIRTRTLVSLTTAPRYTSKTYLCLQVFILSTRLTSPILISHWGNQYVLLILAFRTDRNHQSSLNVYPLCHINHFASWLDIFHCHAIALFTNMVSRAFILANTSSSFLHIRRDWCNIKDLNFYFLLLQTCFY